MKARGILYSAEMIRAKLEGRKTITRRIIVRNGEEPHMSDPRVKCAGMTDGDQMAHFQFEGSSTFHCGFKCPYGKVGDLLYAKETFAPPNESQKPDAILYAADCTTNAVKNAKGIWKPSIFMPKSAARIIDVITGIKVERVQDISTEDILKEGVGREFRSGAKSMTSVNIDFRTWEVCQHQEFKTLWISINGEESWHSNPWVWVIETRNITTKGWSDIPQTS